MQKDFDSLCVANHSETQTQRREPLAVIGIGCRLPGGIHSPSEFWEAILSGLDAVCDVPKDRWNHERFHDTNSEKYGAIRNARGGFIKGVDQFDGDFFGYFPAAAQRIDPQQRLLLEVTHEAMEDAGLRRDQLNRSRTSVFVGSFMYDYLCMQTAGEQRDQINPYVSMGTSVCSLANRISYDFNLTGPSVSLDTACSASLTALHLACQSVWNGEADMAIAGGVNLMLRPEPSIMLSKSGFLNPDQACKAFDESANGYVRGEGVGVVILKPLSRAVADGDPIYACVRASAANQDGYLAEGFTVPNVESQTALLETVYAQAGIDPSHVDYVEAHGTGTPVGDPIETNALGTVLGASRSADQADLIIGSVKTNLGHLEGASGITGFIKGVLTAHHGVVPPNLHFNNPNPAIPWKQHRLQVVTEPTPLVPDDHPLTVGVNSFGAGGANAHVVLQTAQDLTAGLTDDQADAPAVATEKQSRGATLYTLSAMNRDALRELAARHADFLNQTSQPLEAIAHSAFTRRSHYPHRLAIVGETADDIQTQLRGFADGQPESGTLATTMAHRSQPKLAFVFSGQGGQWARMGLQLLEREPVFRQSLEQIDALFQPLADWSILEALEAPAETSKIHDTVVVQPAVMAIQISLVKLYEHYGIRAAGAVGHSIGEVAAAYAAGSLTLEQAVQVIYYRSQAQSRAAGQGGMLAVGLSQQQALELIEDYEGVSIGTINGPEMLTLSGDLLPLQQIAEVLEQRNVFQRAVKVEVAYHSHHMDSIEDLMLQSMASLQGVTATIPLYSTVTTKRETGEHLNAEYWYHNVRQPVRFTDTLSTMVDDGFDTFIEIGPHPVLVRGAQAQFENIDSDAVMVPAMTRSEPEQTVFLQSLAGLVARGCQADTAVLFGGKHAFVRLPKNPWQHSRYWYELPALADQRVGRYEHPFLKRQTQLVSEDGLAVWEAVLDVQKFPYLRDHQVDGEIVFPATGHMELAWAVAQEQFQHETLFLEELQFDSPLILSDNSRYPLDVRLEIVSGEGDYRICTRPADADHDGMWTKHSAGRFNTSHDRFPSATVRFEDLQAQFRDQETQSVDQFYDYLHGAGLAYGESFCCVEQLQKLNNEWLARVRLDDDLVDESQRNAMHPALLDACMHVIFAELHAQGSTDRVYLPYRIDRVRIHARPTSKVWSHVKVTRVDEQYLCSDTLIFDSEGQLVAEVLGITCKRLLTTGGQQADSLYEGCYEYQWLPSPFDPDQHGRIYDCNRAVLVTDDTAFATEFSSRMAAEQVHTQVIPFSDTDRLDDLLADVPLDRRALVVFAAQRTAESQGWSELQDCPAVGSLLALAQTLHRREAVPRLVVVTTAAAAVPPAADACDAKHATDANDSSSNLLDLGQSILHGMSRVINNECPNIPVTVVDLSAQPAKQEVDALFRELLHSRRDQDESEIAIRGPARYVHRLVAVNRETAESSVGSREQGVGGDYRADLQEAGQLDQIVFRRQNPCQLADSDVEIAVQAAALNFKDVMNAMGLLPPHAVSGGLASDRLGLEISGQVLRVGSAVQHVKAGDNVIARVAEGFSGRVSVPGHCVAPRPSHLTPVQAAAIPVVYVTAWYSLCHLARMTRGETVLIHSAAGGVGGAAIRLAQRAGVNVIATAGTREKRDYLRQMGVEHVFDSRSLDFYNDVMDVTDGRGVDIVVNSLTGRFIAQSVKCLAPFGRFIELGKSDIYRNSKLGMERLGENISYFVVDVDRLAAQKPELHQRVLSEVVELFEQHELEPHEITEFPIDKLSEAMRFMTRAAYRGKIVMNMQDNVVQALPQRELSFRGDATYLISGGASGFGLQIARWMAERGARQLVLASRSGCKTDADRALVQSLQAEGVEVRLAKVDLTDAAATRQLLDDIDNGPQPLAGVIHAAAVLDDASIPTMDLDRFGRVFQPKAQGAWHLHQATVAIDAPLDFFVMLSSISSVLGLVGQLNYAAANFFQDSLAHYRRQQGLPATTVNLGVLGEYAGMSNADNDEQNIISLLEAQGMLVMPLADVLGKLESAIIQQPVQRMLSKLNWPWFRMAYPHLARDTRFIECMGDDALARAVRPKGSGLRTELAELEPEEQLRRIEQELTGKLAQILDASADKLDVSVSIDSYGLDSLMLTDLQVWIVRLLDVNLPLIKLLKGPSIANLAVDLLQQVDAGEEVDAGGELDAGNSSAAFTLADMEDIEVVNDWLIRGCSPPDAPFRLICFHSMGVGASLFTKFLVNPPEHFDMLAVQTPGRENRMDEAVVESVEELADQIVPMLTPLFDKPVVIWGHSYGGIVAREVIRRLRQREACTPFHFMVTGTVAPHLIHLWQKREVMLKAMVADNSPEYLVSLSRYVDDAEFLKSIIPLMRRDWPLLKNYRYQSDGPLSCPITAFAARQDDMVYTDEIREWSQHTRDPFELIEVDGDHWFLNRNHQLIAERLHQIALAQLSGELLDQPVT
ncbi:type I polyketide synthase [Roseimaritima ulvae]|uniref:type I polyketide synthase n=1 Tax=Roseimaritima ulvae TaxID=980254 RepID=UPI00082CEDF6|nr:type I polyketide synthase [Roseimaritima ulvae]